MTETNTSSTAATVTAAASATDVASGQPVTVTVEPAAATPAAPMTAPAGVTQPAIPPMPGPDALKAAASHLNLAVATAVRSEVSPIMAKIDALFDHVLDAKLQLGKIEHSVVDSVEGVIAKLSTHPLYLLGAGVAVGIAVTILGGHFVHL
jgi:hypothetical protein